MKERRLIPGWVAALTLLCTAAANATALSPQPPAFGAPVTDVKLASTTSALQKDVPVTFGQVFRAGDLPSNSSLKGKLEDGTGVNMQVDIKARHADGSIRHAIISAVVPSLPGRMTRTLSLIRGPLVSANSPTKPSFPLAPGMNATVTVIIGGVRYSASVEPLLRAGKQARWLTGPLADEWLVSTPLLDGKGNPHKHLSARFAIRHISRSNRARADVTVENSWAYEPSPQNFTYDLAISIDGKTVYTRPALTHYHHARWRKVFWTGGEPAVHIQHNVPYLLATKSLPNYDTSLAMEEKALAAIKSKFSGAVTELMAPGLATPYMPQTGGRADIGILPGWAAAYVLSMDRRAKEATLGTADLAGSWSVHYRNKTTDRPVTLAEFPYMTVLATASNDTFNKATGRKEAFPACVSAVACTSPLVHDSSHQPGFAYLPYLVTGDFYYLEELHFWTHWNSFWSNPAYREHGKGLFKTEQVRAQAWSMRTLAQAAYITPDMDPVKAHFTAMLNANLDWYNANYSSNPNANKLGVLVNGTALGYEGGSGLAPWMDDFFTAAVGHAADLGFSKAVPLLAYKAKFAIDRMTARDTCWIDGAKYSMRVRDSNTSPFYTTYSEVYKKSHTDDFNAMTCNSPQMTTYLRLKSGEMTGYSAETGGYPANMQPALAYGAGLGDAGRTAWKVFMARTVKPNYGMSPQFAIVPR